MTSTAAQETEEQTPETTEPFTSKVLSDPQFKARFEEQMAEMLAVHDKQRPVPTQDISVCGCLKREKWGFRVIQTQEDGKLLDKPKELLVTRSVLDANAKIDEVNRKSGSFAAPDSIFECGHSLAEFQEYWGFTSFS